MGTQNTKEVDCLSIVIGRPRKKRFHPVSSAHSEVADIGLTETEYQASDNFYKIENTLVNLKKKIEYTEQLVAEKRKELKSLADANHAKISLLNKLKMIKLQEAHLERLYDTVNKMEVAKIQLETINMTGMVSKSFENVYKFSADTKQELKKENVMENIEKLTNNMDKFKELDDALQANASTLNGQFTDRELLLELESMYETEPTNPPKKPKTKKPEPKKDTILVEMDETETEATRLIAIEEQNLAEKKKQKKEKQQIFETL